MSAPSYAFTMALKLLEKAVNGKLHRSAEKQESRSALTGSKSSANCTDIGLTAQHSMTSTLDRRSLHLSWVPGCVYILSSCSRFVLSSHPAVEALLCAYFLDGSSAYNYWVSCMPPHNRIRAMSIGHREESTDETMTQTSATTFSRCSNASGCVAYPALGEPAKLSCGKSGPTCFACEVRRV
jgi:hypothetical protein